MIAQRISELERDDSRLSETISGKKFFRDWRSLTLDRRFRLAAWLAFDSIISKDLPVYADREDSALRRLAGNYPSFRQFTTLSLSLKGDV